MPQGARLNIASEPLGSVDMAIAHARRLLEKNPDLAAEQAREILNVDPVHPTARLILGAALRRGGRARQALDVLEPLGSELPHAAPVYLELGVARAETGHLPGAIAALRRALQLNPASADGWRFLADYLQAAGDAGRRRRSKGSIRCRRGPRPALEGSGGCVDAQRFAAGGSPTARSPGRLSDRRGGAAHACRGGGAAAQVRGGSRTAGALP